MTEQILVSEGSSSQSTHPILPVSHDKVGTTSLPLPQVDGTSESEKEGLKKVVNETQRGMQSRHLTMIGTSWIPHSVSTSILSSNFGLAIGGTIGTGIFLSAGIVSRLSRLFHCYEVDIYCIEAISTGGPGSALLSYFILGVFVYAVVITL